jgi:hypothetical protein
LSFFSPINKKSDIEVKNFSWKKLKQGRDNYIKGITDWYDGYLEKLGIDYIHGFGLSIFYHIRWHAQPLRAHQSPHQSQSYRNVLSFFSPINKKSGLHHKLTMHKVLVLILR